MKESVILVGFLNGLWVAVGFNPGAELIAILEGFALSLSGQNGALAFIFAWLPLALLVATLFVILKRGGVVGLIAVGIAFLAGAQVIAHPPAALLLLGAAMVMGIVATA